jgi:hypothetical protein
MNVILSEIQIYNSEIGKNKVLKLCQEKARNTIGKASFVLLLTPKYKLNIP